MKNVQYALVWQRLATVLAVAVLTLSLIAAVTGILLAFYYEPTAGGAYESLRVITTQVSNGWLIQNLHSIAGNGIIALSLVQIVVMFLGERLRPAWLTAWISGILLTLTAIALGWTAMILGWNQLGYWRFKIELETIQAIPLIGPSLRDVLTGGGAVNTVTVEHLYTLHSYLLAIGAVLLAVIHLASLLLQEKEIRQAEIPSADSGVNLDAELS